MRLSRRQFLLLVAPGIVLLVLGFVAPLLYFFRFSLAEPSRTGFAGPGISLDNFVTFLSSSYYLGIYLKTVVIALIATVLTLIVALPASLYLSRRKGWVKNLLLVLALFPMLVGGVVRAIGWVSLLGYSGLVNSILVGLGLSKERHDYSHNVYSLTVALTLLLVPVCILVLTSSLEAMDPAVERAGYDLGARPTRVFFQILLPQLVPGIMAATSLVFVLNMNAYSTPRLVGGPTSPMMATLIYDLMVGRNNWPLGTAAALILLVTSLGLTALYTTYFRRRVLIWRAK